jgi:nitrogenase molybdenum-iron protein NifN
MTEAKVRKTVNDAIGASGADEFEVTRNSCVVCAPLGATLAFAGVERGMTLLHGSQGCSTYIRRYTISHFREPIDAASSSFTEETAVFGGGDRLREAYANMLRAYEPAFIGVATTCLAETIGEDAAAAKRALSPLFSDEGPLVAFVSTPSYRGDHREGFRAALRSIVEAAASDEGRSARPADGFLPVAVFPTILSPMDLRWLKEAFAAFRLRAVLVSDYSDTLDGGPWLAHRLLPSGGTSVVELASLRGAMASIELGSPVADGLSGGAYLAGTFGVPTRRLPLPIGVRATDDFLEVLAELSGLPIPAAFKAERARLLDSYVDAHKVVQNARVLLYGDRDLADALESFCREVGLEPVRPEGEGRDFAAVEAAARASGERGRPIDLLIGNSKGYKTARGLGVPLVRVGFPIHDRYGGQRVRVLGYGGTQELFDRVTNALVERKQETSDVGYTYY